MIFQLSNKTFVQTASSLEPNVTELELEWGEVKDYIFDILCTFSFYKKKKYPFFINDYPGHQNFKEVAYSNIKNSKGIIIMADAADKSFK